MRKIKPRKTERRGACTTHRVQGQDFPQKLIS